MSFQTSIAQAINQISQTTPIVETKASYLASLVKVSNASNTVACAIISDVAEISKQAMNKLLSEIKG